MTPDGAIRPKWLTVAQLKRVLAGMPESYRLQVNAVGNLLVEGEDGFYVGFIDFLHEGEFVDDTTDDGKDWRAGTPSDQQEKS